jgi:hypothetical protein
VGDEGRDRNVAEEYFDLVMKIIEELGIKKKSRETAQRG